MVGGILYSYVKYHEGERKKRDKVSGDSSNLGSDDSKDDQVCANAKGIRKRGHVNCMTPK